MRGEHTMHRIATTNDLLAINERSTQHGFNRTLDPEALDLDPDGLHVLSIALMGHNESAAGVPFHHRTRVMMKFSHRDLPETAWLDLTDTDWQELPTVEAVQAAQEAALLDGREG